MPSYSDTFPGMDLVSAVRDDLDLPEAVWAELRQAATAYQRRVARMLVDPTCAPHGEPGTYTNWGCRCAPCATAYSAQRRGQRVAEDFATTPDDLPDTVRLIKDMQKLGQPLTAKAEATLAAWEAQHAEADVI